ncbi:acyltransferase [bacterium]|nr:acyltransferase [bacterium]
MKNNYFDHGFFCSEELRRMEFKSIGENVKISKICTIIGCENISIGSNTRIDDYSVIISESGSINIGSYVHIASHSIIVGSGEVEIDDYSGISQGAKIYSTTDDYIEGYLSNPMIPDEYRSVVKKKVFLNRFVTIGAGSIVLPGVDIAEGCSIGAQSLVNKNTKEWGLYHGVPARRVADRSKDIAQKFLKKGLKS